MCKSLFALDFLFCTRITIQTEVKDIFLKIPSSLGTLKFIFILPIYVAIKFGQYNSTNNHTSFSFFMKTSAISTGKCRVFIYIYVYTLIFNSEASSSIMHAFSCLYWQFAKGVCLCIGHRERVKQRNKTISPFQCPK